MSNVKISKVLVYGGRGALGSTCVANFKADNWWVGCIDMFPNDDAHCNIVIEASDSWISQAEQVCGKVEEALKGEKVDAIICVAGGWAGGNAASKDFIKNSDMMWKQSVWTSTIAAQLAAKHLNEGGVLTLTGAVPSLGATPGMIGYGMAKAAVHQLVQSLAEDKSGLPNNTFVGAILPVTLDTPMNRKFMANADFSTWTPLQTVADLFLNWTKGKERMESGSLVKLITTGGKTEFIKV